MIKHISISLPYYCKFLHLSCTGLFFGGSLRCFDAENHSGNIFIKDNVFTFPKRGLKFKLELTVKAHLCLKGQNRE